MRLRSLALGLTLLVPAAVSAQPGTLDPSFGSGGIVTTDATAASDGARDGLILPDGRIVVCGIGATGFLLARYQPNGAIDPSFGVGGFVNTAFTGSGVEAHCMLRQPDGKLVVAGEFLSSGNFFSAIARYDTSGTLDPSFGTNGKVSQVIGTVGDIQDVALQPDGKIIIAGSFLVTGTIPFVGLRRYDTNGVLDPTFGNGGTVTRGPGVDNHCYGIALQDDGKIVAAGSTQLTAGADQFLTFRFKPNGTPDSTFATFGRAITSVSAFRNFGKDIVVLPGGRILVGGHTGVAGNPSHQYAVLRFSSAGVLDQSFGAGGIALTPELGISGGSTFLESLLTDGASKIVLTGQATNIGTSDDMALARMDSTGAMDTSFGTGGLVYTDLAGGGRDVSFRVLLQSDGKLMTLGQGGTGVFTGGSRVALVRYAGDAPTADAPVAALGATGVAFAQNAPNPFAARTRLFFRLPRAANVTLRVFDLQGRVLATLVAGEQAAGDHTVEWREGEAGSVGSGIRFARLEVRTSRGIETRTIRMVRVR